jgi:hypothetical protein
LHHFSSRDGFWQATNTVKKLDAANDDHVSISTTDRTKTVTRSFGQGKNFISEKSPSGTKEDI